MIQRIIIILFLSVVVSACANVAPPTARIDWAGTYNELGTRRINFPSSITGKHSRSIGIWQLAQRTTEVTASLGERFGISYTFEAGSSDTAVRHRVIWSFPEGGLTNPITKKTANMNDWEKTCRVGKTCLAGWIFNEPWELVPGIWNVEIWVGDKRLIRQSFKVSVK
jgi:hypothetical protein